MTRSISRTSAAPARPLTRTCSAATAGLTVYLDGYAAKGTVNIKNKKYVLEFQYQNREFTDELCPVKKEATMFIESIARWQMEKMIRKHEMEEMYELCIKAKR